MSFTFAHQKNVQGGGVPLPDGAVTLPASAPCGGTGQPAATYPYTFTIVSENALFYDISIDGGAFSPTTPVPGNPPITGNFTWSLTIDLPTKPTSMQTDTIIPIVLRLRPVADVTAVQKIVNFSATLARCARPVGLTISGCTYNGCDTDRCSVTWSSTTANVGSSTYEGLSVPANGSATVVNDPGTKSFNWQSISGVASDGSSGTVSVNRFYQTECVNDSSCVRSDCRGAPTGCGGNWVTDCRGMCVEPGSAWTVCSECSGGAPATGVCSPPGTCHPPDCRGVGGGGCAGGFVDCDCPSPGTCISAGSCQTRDCNGMCGGSAVQDCAGVCGGSAVDCGCGCNMPCVSCPGGTVSCGGAPCPAAPPVCGIAGGAGPDFSCCGCMPGPTDICSCMGDASQNCSVTVVDTSGATSTFPGSSFSTACIGAGGWDAIANCDGSNPFKPASATMTCDNGSASLSTG